MAERPILLFPSPRVVPPQKAKSGFPQKPHFPSFAEQRDRLTPLFERMQQSFISDTSIGTEPETVLVIETVGSVDNFRRAVDVINGLEWLAELDVEDIEPDAYFYDEKKEEKLLSGRLFLSMSNQRAIDEILSLWRSWDSPEKKLKRGYNKWIDIFKQIKTLRRWDTEDRLRDTHILDYWQEELEIKRGTASTIKFEIELWFRNDHRARTSITTYLNDLVSQEGGKFLNICIIPEIRFHALKAEIPVEGIEKVLNSEYSNLFKCNDVMFFRPSGQCKVELIEAGEDQVENRENSIAGDPFVGIFDGYPMLNHSLLDGRIMLDDPDNFLNYYQASEMKHGTAMASLVCHGELDEQEKSLTNPIYFRPILIPDPNSSNNPRIEIIPENEFLEDLIERATKRIFEGEDDQEAVAPTLKVINLSVGDQYRVFDRRLSSWARLLDWLSEKYQVLFCVSAGNHLQNINLNLGSEVFNEFTEEEKVKKTIEAVVNDTRNRRVFCLGESINSLTIGAIHNDSSSAQQVNGRVDLYPNSNLPSPISAHGYGFRNSIKPDIFLRGGRQLYDLLPNSNNEFAISSSFHSPGQKVATTSSIISNISNTTYCRGTSNSTALATRAATKIISVINEIREDDPNDIIQDDYVAVLIKTLLIHSASWGKNYETLEKVLKDENNSRTFKRYISRYLGYGEANIIRVLECTEQRATAIGCGNINKDEVHEFDYPLPPSLSGSNEHRRLTITLTWFSPVNSTHRNYRRAFLSFKPPSDELLVNRNEAQWQQVQRGTAQHEILIGKSVADYEDGDFIRIPVLCKSDAGELDESVHYGIAVTLEVAEGIELPIYEEVKERVRIEVPIEERV